MPLVVVSKSLKHLRAQPDRGTALRHNPFNRLLRRKSR